MVRQYRQIVQRRRFKIKPRILLRRVGAIVAVVAFLRVAAFALWSNILSTSPANAATPTVASITPNEGPISGGTTVTITGTGFIQGMQWKQLSAGEYHTCGIAVNDQVYCWGANDSGQLGNNKYENSSTPVPIVKGAMADNVTVKQISAGFNHTCVIASNDRAYCWGENNSGQLGDGKSATNSPAPVAVLQGTLPGATIKQIAGGSEHTCAISSDDKAYCWGRNNYGQLGIGSTTPASTSTPVAVVRGTMATNATVEKISTGAYHTCVIANNNQAYCWGQNVAGELGNGPNQPNQSTTPVTVLQGDLTSGATFKDVSLGYSFTCAIASNNWAYCWGENATGEIGNGVSGVNYSTPVEVSRGQIPTGSTMEEISVFGHSCGIASDDKAYCWGLNDYGEIGNGTTNNALTPAAVSQGQMPDGVTASSIATGVYHACAIGSNNLAYCWGNNEYGQLGNGLTASMSTTPVTMPVANPVVTVGGVECSNVSVLSDTQLTCVVPSHAAGAVDVVVSAGGQTGTLASGFTYYGPSVNPSSGPVAGGTEITITSVGEGFGGMSKQVIQNYSICTSAPATFTAPSDGVYAFEVWGAQGGGTNGGRGGYASGEVDLTTGESVQVNVGCQGAPYGTGGWNGGGGGFNTPAAYGGGGATDVRLGGTELTNRILVAGGGGGMGYNSVAGGVGGGNSGTNGGGTGYGNGGTQSAGGAGGVGAAGTGDTGSLGQGGNASRSGSANRYGGGGGGGYYGGGGGGNIQGGSGNGGGGGGGGSGYFDSTLSNGMTIAGNTSMPDPTGGTMNSGRAGDGYARISQMAPNGSVVLDPNGTPANCEITSWSNTEIKCVTSAHAAGTVDVAVNINGGATQTTINGFTYELPLSITGITPDKGPTTGGTEVTISGEGLKQIEGRQVVQIATGAWHSLAVTSDGKVYSWGSNTYGQLGNGNTDNQTSPVVVGMTGALAGKKIVSVAAGEDFSLALTDDGKVYSWGRSVSGQLGIGAGATSQYTPVAVDTTGVLAGKTVIAISASGTISAHSAVALTDDGKVYSWGRNNFGQLGNGNRIDQTSPVAVDTTGVLENKSIKAIAASMDSVLALSNDGQLYSWGYWLGLGNGSGSSSNIPVAVDMTGELSGKTVTAIAAGWGHFLALANDGKVYSWGDNTFSELGTGTYYTGISTCDDDPNAECYSTVPVAVDATGVLSDKVVTGIAGGGNFSLAITDDGRVYSWGSNDYGRLGNGLDPSTMDACTPYEGYTDAPCSYSPVAVDMTGTLSGKEISNIAGGSVHALALANDGKVFSWGVDSSGQLGNGSSTVGMTTCNGEGRANDCFTSPIAVDMTSMYKLYNFTITFDGQYCTDITTGATTITTGFSVDGTSVKCNTPPHAVGTVDVVVSNGTTSSTLANGFTYTDDPGAPYIDLYLDSSTANMGNLTPSDGFASASNTATVMTNNAKGYTLSISTNLPSSDAHASDMKHATLAEYIAGTVNTCAWNSGSGSLTNTDQALTANTWGFTLNPDNLAAQQLCRVPNSDSPLNIKKTAVADEIGDETEIYYGAKIDFTQTPGNYSARVIYTATMNP